MPQPPMRPWTSHTAFGNDGGRILPVRGDGGLVLRTGRPGCRRLPLGRSTSLRPSPDIESEALVAPPPGVHGTRGHLKHDRTDRTDRGMMSGTRSLGCLNVLGALRDGLRVLAWLWGHPANRGKRLGALRRACSHQLRGRILRKPTVARIGRSMVLEVELHSTGASKALYANPPDWPEMLVWRARLSPGDLFIDVGANAGVYALWASDLGAEVIAVEPSGTACRWLRRNFELNDLSFPVVQAAMTNFEGSVGFDSSGDATGHIGGSEVVAATTLDSVLRDRRAAGVKIDVEGFERLVLEGGRHALREQRIGCLQLEWNQCSQAALGEDRSPVAALLAGFGYMLHRPDDDGRLVPVDEPDFGADVFALPSHVR